MAMVGSAKEHALERCPALVAYCDRVRGELYPELTADPVAAESMARGGGRGGGGGGGDAEAGAALEEGAGALRVPLAGSGRGAGAEASGGGAGGAQRVLAWAPDLSRMGPGAEALGMVHRLKRMEKEVSKDRDGAGWWRPHGGGQVQQAKGASGDPGSKMAAGATE